MNRVSMARQCSKKRVQEQTRHTTFFREAGPPNAGFEETSVSAPFALNLKWSKKTRASTLIITN